ncbi:N-6 DNA methylase [Actinomadura sp. WAC 06369]|uniref:N-6 DNA methylase n=1 Tax=Actinomadura sp. WAC 06369 TaxID=2203193 RepID=UPI000F768824|nr:N-6 DNA methylase [Actinomadura sp. WAC 06369]RSN64511.1 N-6 DNA methylase [Actinomadura sp. WAC 06369]
MPTAKNPAPAVVVAGSIPEGKIRDFLTGKIVKDTPEEYVRQNIEKALVRQYGYDPKDCAPEFSIKVGSSRKRIDIAVFKPGAPHLQENIYIIVETKKPGTNRTSRTEGVEQLKSYLSAALNASYGVWTNGDDRECFAKRPGTQGTHSIEEILEIPAAGQSEEEAQRPRRRDLRPATGDNLLFAFRRCHNYIAANEGKQKPEAFWELLKLIFCKIEDERSKRLSFFVTPTERASATNAVPAKARIERIFKEKVLSKYPSIFVGADREIDLNASVVAYVVGQLQSISLLASPVDVKGVAYEEIVGSNLRGDRGEFFTPRNACRMAVRMLNPKPGERVIDPSCGTGGFLITAMNSAVEQIRQDHREQWINPNAPTPAEQEELWRARSEYLSSSIYGLDLNPALVRAAKMNMVMNNDGSGGLWQANSLANPHTWRPEAAAKIKLGTMDIVVANPPFGTNIRVDDQEILQQYELAAAWDLNEQGEWNKRGDHSGTHVLRRSQPPEILFIERCVQLLREGGRMAIVLPNGILNNPALGYVRHWLLQNTQILAVVDMARDLFQPKNDTQTSMLVLRKLTQKEKDDARAKGLDYPIFMAIAETVGRDKRGNVIYRRDEAGEDILISRTEVISEIDPATGADVERQVTVTERLIDDELEDVAAAYNAWLTEFE